MLSIKKDTCFSIFITTNTTVYKNSEEKLAHRQLVFGKIHTEGLPLTRGLVLGGTHRYKSAAKRVHNPTVVTEVPL